MIAARACRTSALPHGAGVRRLLPLLSVVVLLAGCGEQRGTQDRPSGGDEPTTPASLAYVAAQHVGEPDSADVGSNMADAFRHAPLEVELVFGSTGEYDGDAVQVVVGRGFDKRFRGCARLGNRVSGCEDLPDGFWYWGEEEPEEDPGAVIVVQRKGPVTVAVAYYGPTIKGDPRDQELPIDVGTLIELAADPRVDMTTTEEAVEGGASASYWRG